MKFNNLVLSAALASAAAVPQPDNAELDKRQANGWGGLIQIGMAVMAAMNKAASRPFKEPMTVTKAKSELFPQAKRERFIYGPFKLNGAKVRRVDKTPGKCCVLMQVGKPRRIWC